MHLGTLIAIIFNGVNRTVVVTLKQLIQFVSTRCNLFLTVEAVVKLLGLGMEGRALVPAVTV